MLQQNLYKLINLPRNFHTLFALWIASNSLGKTCMSMETVFADYSNRKGLLHELSRLIFNLTEVQMGDTDQPLKLIYAWKKMLHQYGPTATVGKGEGELPALYLWRNVFFPPATEQNVRLKGVH